MYRSLRILDISLMKYDLIAELMRNKDWPVDVVEICLEQIKELEDERRLLKET